MKCNIFVFLLGIATSVFCQETVLQTDKAGDFLYSAAAADKFLKKSNYIGAISTYKEFVEKHDICIAVSHLQIANIYQDHLSDYQKAMMNYRKVLSEKTDGRLTDLSKKVASRWFERIRLNFLKDALKRYYISEVEYPASLRELSAKGHIDHDYLIDSSGKSYVYEPRASELSQKLRNQEYELHCQSLGRETKPLSALIDEKKAFESRFLLEGLLGGTGGEVAIIQYKPAPSSDKPLTKTVREGEKIDRAQVIVIGEAGAILYWEDGILVLTIKKGT